MNEDRNLSKTKKTVFHQDAAILRDGGQSASRPLAAEQRVRQSVAPSLSFLVALMSLVMVVFGLAKHSWADSTLLYDGSLNTTPDHQGWKYIAKMASAVQSAAAGVTNLDTTANAGEQAGYFSKIPVPPHTHPSVPELQRSAGFTISFSVRIVEEHHGTRVDRAGFSVIVITHDLKGIELGFWTNEVWAQDDSPLFIHAEGTSFDTTADVISYDLVIVGDNYELSANGSSILTGPLRDYAAFAPTTPPYAVYRIPDFLFFGDDTTSASASIQLASIAYDDEVPSLKGDINGDKVIDLDDAMLALRVCIGLNPLGVIPVHESSDGDVNGDGRIGIEDVIYILQAISRLNK
jgi:hypothetical protein